MIFHPTIKEYFYGMESQTYTDPYTHKSEIDYTTPYEEKVAYHKRPKSVFGDDMWK